MELGEAHRLIFEPNVFRPYSVPNSFFIPADPAAVVGSKKVLDYTASSSQLGTMVLEVPECYEYRGCYLQCVYPSVWQQCGKIGV